jgi:hypothetical protein
MRRMLKEEKTGARLVGCVFFETRAAHRLSVCNMTSLSLYARRDFAVVTHPGSEFPPEGIAYIVTRKSAFFSRTPRSVSVILFLKESIDSA